MTLRMSEEDTLEHGRQCYICLETTLTPAVNDWVRPCRCRGTMTWVHKQCVLRWVRMRDAYYCPQCLTTYQISPKKGLFLKGLEFIDKKIYPCVKDGASAMIFYVIFDMGISILGTVVLNLVYGVEDTVEMLMSPDITDTLVKVHFTPLPLLVISCIPWEDFLLKTLKYGAQLPILRLFLPTNTSPLSTQIFHRRLSIRRILCGSVMLPVFGRICGEIVFSNVDDTFTRTLLGGISYLLVKGGLYMYYSQKLMVWLDQIQVLPFESDSQSTKQRVNPEDSSNQIIVRQQQGTEGGSQHIQQGSDEIQGNEQVPNQDTSPFNA